jgi:cytochrome oxidase Cu insertion factor (SCO1/SenC/PrrC family)
MPVSETAARTRSRASLLLIFSLFAAPVMLAWLLFFVFPEWVPTSTSNHGELIQPARPLPAFQLESLSGDAVNESSLQGKWTFVYLHQGACDEACIQQLYKVRQVRLTQGKNIDRLQRLMLWEASGVEESVRRELQQHFPGQAIAIVPDVDLPLLKTFDLSESSPFISGGVYLVDPLGNLMMKYALDQEPRGMIKDLERLLKYSALR